MEKQEVIEIRDAIQYIKNRLDLLAQSIEREGLFDLKQLSEDFREYAVDTFCRIVSKQQCECELNLRITPQGLLCYQCNHEEWKQSWGD